MSNNDRMAYIRDYFEKQKQVLVEIQPQISETTKGNIIYRFNGVRCGYKFKDGKAWIDRKDIQLFRESFPHMKIHDQEEKNMHIKDKILAFSEEYWQQLEKITGRINETEKRVSDISLEIQFIQQVEIPQAVERRVLLGDDAQEKKVRRSLEKLQEEHQALSEEILVLQNVLTRFKQDQAAKVPELQRPLQDEIRLTSPAAYAKMIAAKQEYENVIRRESKPLRDLRDLDVKLQEIEVQGGRRSYVYTDLNLQREANQLPVIYKDISNLIKSRS